MLNFSFSIFYLIWNIFFYFIWNATRCAIQKQCFYKTLLQENVGHQSFSNSIRELIRKISSFFAFLFNHNNRNNYYVGSLCVYEYVYVCVSQAKNRLQILYVYAVFSHFICLDFPLYSLYFFNFSFTFFSCLLFFVLRFFLFLFSLFPSIVFSFLSFFLSLSFIHSLFNSE